MRLREAGGEHLHAADVRLARAIFRVDRERERFDRREMQVRHFLHVALLVFDAAQIDLVAAIGQIQRRRGQQRDPVVGRAADDDRHASRRDRADEIARRAPQEIFVPDLQQALVRRQRDRRGDQRRVAEEVGAGRAEQRLRHRRERHRREARTVRRARETPSRRPAR